MIFTCSVLRLLGPRTERRPLGSRTMALKFVVTKLDALAGSRVAVSELLIGEGGVDGINVTTVTASPRSALNL